MSPVPARSSAGPGPIRLIVFSPWIERLLLVLFVLLMRLPSFAPSVIDWDESLYVLMARDILADHLPYVTIFQEKPLGASMMVALAMGIMGQSLTAVRILGFIVVAATSLLLREIALTAGLSRVAAALAAIAYGGMTPGIGGLATNTEILLAPFTVTAVWVGVVHIDTARFRSQATAIAIAGACFGVAIWCKYVPAFPACALFGVLVGSWLWHGRVSWRGALILGAIYAVTCGLPSLLSATVFAWAGQWDLFWYSNFGFMSVYRGVPDPSAEIIGRLWQVGPALPLLAFGVSGLLFWRRSPAFVGALFIWLLAEMVAVAAPGKFFAHYFLMLFPPLCLLFAVAVNALTRKLPVLWQVGGARVPAVWVSLAAVGAAGAMLATGRLDLPGPDTAQQVATLIRGDPTPDPTAWVVNSEPIIYFLAGIPVPTRFPFPPHIMTEYSALMRMDPALEVARILATQPRYLIVDPNRWPDALPPLRAQVLAALEADYRLAEHVPTRQLPVELYRRKD